MKEEVFEIIISELDYHLIEKIREMRIKHDPYLSMLQLSIHLDLAESALARIENMKKRDRYNIRTLNKVANFFNLQSYAEMFPNKILKNDMVRIRLKRAPIKRGKLKPNSDGSVDKAYTVISVTPLTEKEIGLYHAKKMPYLTIIE